MLIPKRVGRSSNFIFPTIVILKSLKVGYWLIEKFFPQQKAPQISLNIMNSFCGSYELKFIQCARKNISLRLATNQFGFNWKKHNTYINSKMTSTTQVVNTLSSIKTHTHKNLSKKFVDCNLLIPIPFQLFCQLPRHVLFTFPTTTRFPPKKHTGKNRGKNRENPKGFPGSTNQPSLRFGVLGAWIELGLSCEIRPGPRSTAPSGIPWGMIFGTPKK